MRLRIPHMNCQLVPEQPGPHLEVEPGQDFDVGRQSHADGVDDQLVEVLVARVRLGQLQVD